MILRQVIAETATTRRLFKSPVKFISLFDHMLKSAELEADKIGYELDDNAAYVRCCELLTAADMGAELSYADRLNLVSVISEFYRGDPWRTVE